MLTAPTRWNEIAAMPDARIQCRLKYYPDGTHVAYLYDDDLSSNGVSLEGGISDGGSIVGNLVSRRLSFTIKDYAPNEALIQCHIGNKGSTVFPSGSIFYLYLWMHSDIGVVINGARWRDSGYLSFGVMPFYVTEKIISGNDLTIVAYDIFKMLEMVRAVSLSNSSTGNITIDNLASYIGGITGVKDAILTDYDTYRTYSVPIQSIKEQNLSKADLLRMFCRLYATNLIIDINQSTQNKVKSIMAYDTVNVQIPPSSARLDLSSRALISKYYGKKQLGQLTTCESLAITQPTVLTDAVFNVGSEYITTPTIYGNYLRVEVPDYLSSENLTQSGVWSMSRHLKRNFYSLYCYSVEATGAVFNPLYEPGDVLSVPLGNGNYCNFVPLSTRMNINGLCYGSAFAGIKNDAIYNKIVTYQSSTYHAQNIASNQAVNIEFLGSHTFIIKLIKLDYPITYDNTYLTGGRPIIAKIDNVTLSNITVVYVDVNNVSHTITFNGVLANSNNAYYWTDSNWKVPYDGTITPGNCLVIRDVVFYSTQELPTADQVKSITSCDLVLKNSGDSGDGQVITIYVNNTA